MAAKVWGIWFWVKGLMVPLASAFEGWAFQKRVPKLRFGLFYVRKHEFSANILRFIG